jgi:hypothetical protein
MVARTCESPKRPAAHTSFVRASAVAIGRPTIPVAPDIKILVSCSIVLSSRISVGQYSTAGGLPPAEFEQKAWPLKRNPGVG